MTTKIYTAFDPPPAVELLCKDKSLTRQSEMKACDINEIIKQYDRTGLLPTASLTGLYADVSTMGDYRDAINQVQLAQTFFAALPATTRATFDNDPAKFLDYCSDPNNRDGLIELGLIEAPIVAPTPQPDPNQTGVS